MATILECILFECISQEARIALANYQWEHFKSRLDIPEQPPAPAYDKALEPEPDPELIRLMKLPPSATGRGGY